MKKQILEKNLEVSAVSLGCMGMTHAYGAPSDINEMSKLIVQAVDIGYTMFDTAECYTLTDSYKKGTIFNESGDYRSFMPQFKPEAYDENRELLDMLYVQIPGTRKLTRLEDNANSANMELTEGEVSKIDNLLSQMKMSEIFVGSRVNR